MATQIVPGQTTWSREDDQESGYRTYIITFQTIGAAADGPNAHSQTIGLPRTNDTWNFESVPDVWSFCTPYRSIKPRATKGPNTLFDHEYKFTNKPPEVPKCQDQTATNPLLEPMQLSGSFSKYQEEGRLDRFGRRITSSSWEPIRGKQNEWDASRPGVQIVQNVPLLELPLLSWLIDCVNDLAMWGLPSRCVKLSSITWEEKYYGQCFKYFTRTLNFETNRKTWDREMQDEGTKVLNGRWTRNHHWELLPVGGKPADRFNPSHFIKFPDYNGNHINGVLNGRGLPAGSCIDGITLEEDFDEVSIYINTGGPSVGPGASMGIKYTNSDWWVKWKPAEGETAFAIPPNDWVNTRRYYRGSTVRHLGTTWLCLAENLNSTPVASNSNWSLVIGGLINQGVYNNATLYVKGDYITESTLTGTGTGPCNETAIGTVYVQKYFSANLFLLGLPAIIGF